MKKKEKKKYILPSVLVIVMCMTCFIGACWAWFTAQSTAEVSDIHAATFGVKVEVINANGRVIQTSKANVSHTLDLESGKKYTVRLTGSGEASTGYCGISFVDSVTQKTQSYYTSAIEPGSSYEFTYFNGSISTSKYPAAIQWENVLNSTVREGSLTITAYWGETDENVMEESKESVIATNWHGGYITSDQSEKPYRLIESANYSYTDVITIPKKGTKITFTDASKNKGSASKNVYVISSWKWDQDAEDWVLDKEGTNIRGAQYTGEGQYACDTGKQYNWIIEKHSTSGDTTSITYTYITSKDNEHIRLNYHSASQTDIPVITSVYSGEVGTAEEIALTQNSADWLKTQQSGSTYEKYKELFEGKTISVIGDSYFFGKDLLDTKNQSGPSQDAWPSLFARKYNMTFNNYGISGSTISNYAGDSYNPMVDRWTDIADNNPDIILVEGGRNDYSQDVPIGELGDGNEGTFKGATEYLISSLKEKFPNALIIGVTCWKVNLREGTNALGLYSNHYGYAFADVCEEMGIPCINAMDSEAMGVYMTNEYFRGRFCIKAGDVSHLNEKGMKLVLPAFEKQIYNIYKEHLNQ